MSWRSHVVLSANGRRPAAASKYMCCRLAQNARRRSGHIVADLSFHTSDLSPKRRVACLRFNTQPSVYPGCELTPLAKADGTKMEAARAVTRNKETLV